MDKKLLLVLVVIIIVVVIIFLKNNPMKSLEKDQVSVGEKIYKIEIVDNVVSQAKGLAGRESLEAGSGMLFIFKKSAVKPFWMKGMKFPLDIIWISDNRVIGFSENATLDPERPSALFLPPGSVNMVLEVNAGVVEQDELKVGDEIDFTN